MKIVTIIGARPQFIKAAAVSRKLRSNRDFKEVIIHTGQHYDDNMSGVFFRELDLPEPDYHLGVGSGDHGAQTGRMLAAIEEVLIREQPAWALVYGDTNSTLAGALAAAKLHIPVAHVEAGLRSWDRRMPEEINRLVADCVCDLLFAPSATAASNLQREGVDNRAVHLVGDVMHDSAMYYLPKADNSGILRALSLTPKKYVLATCHRPSNTDNSGHLLAIYEGLQRASRAVPVVWPLHPRTLSQLERLGVDLASHNGAFILTAPVGYLDMLALGKNSRLIVTDSGGLQREAFFCGVPSLVLRDRTEWVELVDLGWTRLCVPKSSHSIERTVLNCLDMTGKAGEPYGSGDAGTKIAEILATFRSQ